MKNNRQLNALKERDKLFHIIFYVLLIVPVLYFSILAIQGFYTDYQIWHDINFDDGINYEEDVLWNLYEDLFIPVFLCSLVVIQIIRWWHFEGSSLHFSNLALPVRRKTRLSYDLRTGYLAIVIINLIYGSILCIRRFLEYNHMKQIMKQNSVLMSFSNLYQELSANALTHILLTVLLCIMNAAIIYTLLVLGKTVARSIGWAFVFFCAVLVCYFTGFELLTDALWNLQHSASVFVWADDRLSGYDYYNLAFDAVLIICMFIFLCISIYCTYLVSSKVDEAKGSAYYFRWAQIFVSVIIAASFFFPVITSYTDDLPVGKVLYISATYLFTLGIFAGIFYLTNPKRK